MVLIEITKGEMIFKYAEFALGIGALILALATEAKVRRVLRSATDITESISTRYVATFPDNIDEIVKLISGTKRRLTIVCDVPKYGHYSDPHGFAEYNAAIMSVQAKSTRPVITMITYNSNKRRQNARNQFHDMTYEDLTSSDSFKKYFEYFANVKISPPKDKTKEGFYQWLDEKHCDYLRQLADQGVQTYESNKDFPSFIWISDESAIFSFNNLGTYRREVSFKTFDPTLINILVKIAEEAMGAKEEPMSPAESAHSAG